MTKALGLGWSFPVDSWSAGMIMIWLLTGKLPISSTHEPEVLFQMQCLLGDIPLGLARIAVDRFPEYFHLDNGALRQTKDGSKFDRTPSLAVCYLFQKKTLLTW
jgi:hypothetical protein